jgi:negative regulator of sigma E activity
MEPQTPISRSYSLEQFAFDCVAIRRELGITSNRMTKEQEKMYLDAKQKVWREKTNWQPSTPPYGRPQTATEKSEPQS